MKLQALTDKELMDKRLSIVTQLKTAKGYTKNDLYKALHKIDKERVRRAWEGV